MDGPPGDGAGIDTEGSLELPVHPVPQLTMYAPALGGHRVS